MRRRTFLAFALAALSASPALAAEINVEEILGDPAAPVGGDPKGDVTIVAFLDYNCPFCKKATPGLARAVRDDGHTRLVYKDWPILAPSSVDGAELALAAKYQGKYEEAHAAMMALKGRSTPQQFRAPSKAPASTWLGSTPTSPPTARDHGAHQAQQRRGGIAGASGHAGFPHRPLPGRRRHRLR